MPFGTEKLDWCGYAVHGEKKIDDMFIRFDRIHERDGHTHTQTAAEQTPHDDIGRACIASRGKNRDSWRISGPARTAGSYVPSTLGRYASNSVDRPRAIHKCRSATHQ